MIREAIEALESKLRKPGAVCSSPDAAAALAKLAIAAEDREHLGAMYLDAQNALIESRVEFIGGLAACTVEPRFITKRALELNAAGVILFHNHPSGHTDPSPTDDRITARIKDCLSLFDIRLLDHLVVGRDVFSYAEKGRL